MKHGLMMVSALVLAVGCEKANKGSIADDIPAGEVRLIGAGVAPRTVLTYQVDKGTHVTLDMVMHLGMEAPGLPIPAMPTIKMSMDETCTDVEPSGAMRFEVKVGSISADGSGPMAEAMAHASDMMKDMVYKFRLSPSGKIDDVSVDGLTGAMADVGAQMKNAIEQFAAPLPTDAVGKGSTWKFKRTGEANGVKMATVNQFELLELKDQIATFKVAGRVVAPSQTIEKNGISIKVDKMDGDVHGVIANDLKRFAPAGTFGMTMDMAMSAAGQKLKIHMTIDSEITAH